MGNVGRRSIQRNFHRDDRCSAADIRISSAPPVFAPRTTTGSDRGRTCDPHHVKVSRRERNVVKPGIFCFPSVETEPERLPNEGGFAIKLLSSGLRSRFIPWAGSARKVVPLVISLTFKLIGPARAAPALSSGGTLGLGALPRRKANTTERGEETHPPCYLVEPWR